MKISNKEISNILESINVYYYWEDVSVENDVEYAIGFMSDIGYCYSKNLGFEEPLAQLELHCKSFNIDEHYEMMSQYGGRYTLDNSNEIKKKLDEILVILKALNDPRK